MQDISRFEKFEYKKQRSLQLLGEQFYGFEELIELFISSEKEKKVCKLWTK